MYQRDNRLICQPHRTVQVLLGRCVADVVYEHFHQVKIILHRIGQQFRQRCEERVVKVLRRVVIGKCLNMQVQSGFSMILYRKTTLTVNQIVAVDFVGHFGRGVRHIWGKGSIGGAMAKPVYPVVGIPMVIRNRRLIILVHVHRQKEESLRAVTAIECRIYQIVSILQNGFPIDPFCFALQNLAHQSRILIQRQRHLFHRIALVVKIVIIVRFTLPDA